MWGMVIAPLAIKGCGPAACSRSSSGKLSPPRESQLPDRCPTAAVIIRRAIDRVKPRRSPENLGFNANLSHDAAIDPASWKFFEVHRRVVSGGWPKTISNLKSHFETRALNDQYPV